MVVSASPRLGETRNSWSTHVLRCCCSLSLCSEPRSYLAIVRWPVKNTPRLPKREIITAEASTPTAPIGVISPHGSMQSLPAGTHRN